MSEAPDVAQLAAVLGGIAEGVTVQDATGRVVYANAVAARMTGYPSPEAMLADAAHIVDHFQMLDEHGNRLSTNQLPARRVLHGEPVDEILIQYRDTNSETRWTLLSATPIRDANSELQLVVNLFRDITDRKRQTEMLQEAMQQRDRALADAQEALRVRDEFLASASHDLKTPLSSIKATAQMLLRHVDLLDETDRERIRQGLRSIDLIATRAGGLVEGLSDLTRIRVGQPLELEYRPVDLVALAREVTREHQGATERHTLEVQASQVELVGNWDRRRIGRVLSNLVDNAIKYSPDGGLVVVRVLRDADWAVVEVKDHGIGIPEAELGRVFERFGRASNAAQRIDGTGIGLASAHHIIQSHGGSIGAQSREGAGATFTVRLPIRD